MFPYEENKNGKGLEGEVPSAELERDSVEGD